MNFDTFKELLAMRGMTPALLLQRARVPRAHGHQVLTGARSGPETRAKIARELTAEELAVLGWETPPREELVVEASGDCDFVARLEYTPGPGVQMLIDTFQDAMRDLHRVNRTSKAELMRRDVAA